MRWQRPAVEEQALVQLVSDTEERIRFKLNSVNRLRNTILYAEKVRQEWEVKAALALASVKEDPSPFASPMLQPMPTTTVTEKVEDLLLSPPSQTPQLRQQRSHLFDALTPPMSPLYSPDDSGLKSPGAFALPSSVRLPTSMPSSRTKSSTIKDFEMLKPISKGACTFLPPRERFNID